MLRLKGTLYQERLWFSYSLCPRQVEPISDVVVNRDSTEEGVEDTTEAIAEERAQDAEDRAQDVEEYATEDGMGDTTESIANDATESIANDATESIANDSIASDIEYVTENRLYDIEEATEDVVVKEPESDQVSSQDRPKEESSKVEKEPMPRLSHASTLSSSFSIPSPTTPPASARDAFRPIKSSLFRRESARLNNKRKSLTKKIKNVSILNKLMAH